MVRHDLRRQRVERCQVPADAGNAGEAAQAGIDRTAGRRLLRAAGDRRLVTVGRGTNVGIGVIDRVIENDVIVAFG